MDEDGGKHAEDDRRREREHAQETVKYLRRWSAEARKESEETQEVVEVDVEDGRRKHNQR